MENKLIEDSKKALFLNVEKLVAVFFSFLFSVIFLIKSPLHPWVGDVAQTDSSVFKTVALMMEKGFMPYKDSFDHKGPFLYIILQP